jgi:hypothetical protein
MPIRMITSIMARIISKFLDDLMAHRVIGARAAGG